MLNTFESKSDIIDRELRKRRGKWQLKARLDLDYDDVKQIIRLHVWKKWHLWDQTQPLEPWLNRIISRQISNILRDNYTSFSSPCIRCPANENNGLCSIYTKQCTECPLFAKWSKSKKAACDVKLPVSLHEEELDIDQNLESNDIDYDLYVGMLHDHMKVKLSPKQFGVYKLLYIDNKSEQEAASILGLSDDATEEYRKTSRCKQLEIYKKHFISIAGQFFKDLQINHKHLVF